MTARPPSPLRAPPDASRVGEPTGCTGIPEGDLPARTRGRAGAQAHKGIGIASRSAPRAAGSNPGAVAPHLVTIVLADLRRAARWGEPLKPSIAETWALSYLVPPYDVGRVVHDKARAGRSVRLTAAQVVRVLALAEGRP